MSLVADDALARWLAPVSKGSPQRESAIKSAGDELSRSAGLEMLDLVLLAFGAPHGQAAERVREAVHRHDPSFPGRPADAQTQIAAAWGVATAVSHQGRELAPLAAMAVGSAQFAGLNTRAIGLIESAEASLLGRSNEVRSRTPLPRVVQGLPKAIGELQFEPEIPATTTELAELLTATRSALSTMNKRMDGLRQSADRQLLALNEELDLLWWALRRRPDGSLRSWTAVGPSAGVRAGAEMARLTRFDVPIPSAHALLAEALDGCPPALLAEAVSELDPDQQRLHTPPHALLPVTRAMRTGDEVDENQTEYEPATLAMQTLRERLMGDLL